MKMHNEHYKELLLRFAKELHDVGVTENMRNIVISKVDRVPNVASAGAEIDSAKFVYRHGDYMIEAVQVVKLSVKKCS
jgi:hypothetical protein